MSITARMSRRGKWTFPSIMQLSYECIAKINIKLKQRIIYASCKRMFKVLHSTHTQHSAEMKIILLPLRIILCMNSFYFLQLFLGCQAASDDQICPELIRAVEGVRYIADITRYCSLDTVLTIIFYILETMSRCVPFIIHALKLFWCSTFGWEKWWMNDKYIDNICFLWSAYVHFYKYQAKVLFVFIRHSSQWYVLGSFGIYTYLREK